MIHETTRSGTKQKVAGGWRGFMLFRVTSWMNTFAGRLALPLFTLASVLALVSLPASGQCALCKAAAESLDGAAARNLNLAVLLLLTPPVTVFCAIFYVAYKKRNSPGEEP
ncbi:MAG: hypothetical protein ACRD9R_05455 [Pyrinomonadaceae bacterium]